MVEQNLRNSCSSFSQTNNEKEFKFRQQLFILPLNISWKLLTKSAPYAYLKLNSIGEIRQQRS